VLLGHILVVAVVIVILVVAAVVGVDNHIAFASFSF
jgi:hypothetical protein